MNNESKFGEKPHIKYNNGIVCKTPTYPMHLKVFPIFENYEKVYGSLNFIPKILNYNETSYSYEYIDEITIKDKLINDGIICGPISQKMILELKIAMDDIWKKLYQMSVEQLPTGDFLYYSDPHLGNMIWRDDSKELILLDMDCFEIRRYIPISWLNNQFIQQLENYIHVYR